MSESLTGAEATQESVASQEPTAAVAQQNPAESQNQEAISQEAQTGGKEPVSDDTATQVPTDTEDQKQTQQTSGESQTDDGLAKFAKSQGFDLEGASDEVKRALKIAHDNQKAFRSQSHKGPKVAEAAESFSDGSIEAEVAQIKYERTTDKFFSQDGIDRSLEPAMVDILKEKEESYGKEYAFNLSRDLDTLYGLAQIKSGKVTNVDPEAIRREERESINKQMSASAPQAHATQQGQENAPKLTPEWFTNVYDSRNPEHIKLLQEAGLR